MTKHSRIYFSNGLHGGKPK